MQPAFVICGPEHSGTTVLSQVFRQVPKYDSGFEVGVLLCRSPQRFRELEPYYHNMKAGWGLADEDLLYATKQDSFDGFYRALWERARALKPDTEVLFDKTPRYLAKLDKCLQRTDAPFIVTIKDPRSLVASDFLRSEATDFASWWPAYRGKKKSYLRTLYSQYAAFKDNPRVIVCRSEDVCLDPAGTFSALFDRLGLAFDESLLDIRRNRRYGHVKGPAIAAEYAYRFQQVLTAQQAETVRHAFAEFEDFFYFP